MPDRKSTRLNSSHLGISYAVFCLNYLRSPASSPLSLHDALPICHGDQRSLSAAVRGQAPGEHRPLLGRLADQPVSYARIARRRCARGPSLSEARQEFSGLRRDARSEEHTSELQSLRHLVCRLLLELSALPRILPPFPTRRSSDLSW